MNGQLYGEEVWLIALRVDALILQGIYWPQFMSPPHEHELLWLMYT